MKRIINVFVLLLVCLFCLGLFVNVSADSLSADESTSLKNMLTKYYDEGYYQKDTVINLNQASMAEAGKYFHVETHLERTTLFDGNELFMTNADGSINSGYGTDANGDMVHFTKDANGLNVVDYTVAIPNSGGMEEYYYTLKDLTELDYSEWSLSNGVYTYAPSNPSNEDIWFTMFRDITAPCFLNSDVKSRNYVLFSKITIEEVLDRLILKLYVNQGDYSKLTEEHQTDLCFSEATIIGGHLVDLGTIGGTNSLLYNINIIRTKKAIVVEGLTEDSFSDSGLEKIEVFINIDKFYSREKDPTDVTAGGTSTSSYGSRRTRDHILVNYFLSGLLRVYNFPMTKQTELFNKKGIFTYKNVSGATVSNTAVVRTGGTSSMRLEVSYKFLEQIMLDERAVDGATAKYEINETTPIGLYLLSSTKKNNAWPTDDNWSYKTQSGSNKNYPSDLAIIGHDNKLYKNYATYTADILSSFGKLDSYVTTAFGTGLTDNMATITGHTMKEYVSGNYIFSDRDAHVVPETNVIGALNGLHYIYDSVSGSGTKITAQTSGYLLLLADDNSINNTNLAQWSFLVRSCVKNHGIKCASASLYLIWINQGESVTVPANAVVFTK